MRNGGIVCELAYTSGTLSVSQIMELMETIVAHAEAHVKKFPHHNQPQPDILTHIVLMRAHNPLQLLTHPWNDRLGVVSNLWRVGVEGKYEYELRTEFFVDTGH